MNKKERKIEPRIIVAVDNAPLDCPERLFSSYDPEICSVKIGKELFTRYGPSVVNIAHASGFRVFLDLKFHDIPNTVAKAVQAAADLGVWMVNLHAAGGTAMMQQAREILDKGGYPTKLIAVTLLTSLSQENLVQMGIQKSTDSYVLHLAQLAQQTGLHGVVCSPHEVALIKKTIPEPFLRVTPGIRDSQIQYHDQKRVSTPENAIKAGSSHLVIGRSITQAVNPTQALHAIQQRIYPLL